MRRSNTLLVTVLAAAAVALLFWISPWKRHSDLPLQADVSAGKPRELAREMNQIAQSQREDFLPDRGVGAASSKYLAREPVEVVDPSGGDAARDELDNSIRAWAKRLSTGDLMSRWLAETDLVEAFVSAVDQVAEGRAPRKTLGFMRPGGSFRASARDREYRIDPASFARYDALTDAFVSIDPLTAARAYRQLYTTFQTAYAGLGYPGRSFDERLREAADVLLGTPVIEENPRLQPHIGRFQFADPNLEGLYDVQKQLLRAGPQNLRRIHEHLRELLAALDSSGPLPG